VHSCLQIVGEICVEAGEPLTDRACSCLVVGVSMGVVPVSFSDSLRAFYSKCHARRHRNYCVQAMFLSQVR